MGDRRQSQFAGQARPAAKLAQGRRATVADGRSSAARAVSDEDDDVVQVSYTQSTWQKKKVRTFHVNSRSRIPWERSVSGALTKAEPYDRIEVATGDYYESISVSFPVEIVASDGESPIVAYRGAALQCATDVPCFVQGIQFVCKAKGKLDFAVTLSMGTAELVECKVSSLHVTGSARPTVTQCEITQSPNGTGLRLTERCGGTIAENRIHNHHDTCVHCDCTGDPVVKDNTILQYRPSVGIACFGVASSFNASEPLDEAGLSCRRVRFEKNTVSLDPDSPFAVGDDDPTNRPAIIGAHGELPCVFVAYGAAPQFHGNCVHKGTVGFLFEAGGTPVMEGNQVLGQREVGLRMTLGSQQQEGGLTFAYRGGVSITGHNSIDRCKVGIDVVGSRIGAHAEEEAAIAEKRAKLVHRLQALGAPPKDTAVGRAEQDIAKAKALVTEYLAASAADVGVNLQKMRVTSCTDDGVTYRNGAYGHVESCEINGSGGSGIVAETGSFPTIARCAFTLNGASAIAVRTFADPTIIGNSITAQQSDGISFERYARGVALENTLSTNQGSAIAVADASTPLIMRNVMAGNAGGGVSVLDSARPRVAYNTLTNNSGFGVCCASAAHPVLEHNVVHATNGSGLIFTDCAAGTAQHNTVTESVFSGVLLELDADPYIEANAITSSGENGVTVRNNGVGSIVGNDITKSAGFNILVTEGSEPTVRGNTVTRGSRGGIAVADEGLGTVERNTLRDNLFVGILVDGRHAAPLVAHNDVRRTQGTGIRCVHGSGGTVRCNHVEENKDAGIATETEACPHVTRNHAVREKIGFLAQQHGAGVFERNTATQCYVAGMLVQDRATPVVRHNTVTGGTLAGISLGTGCGGEVSDNEATGNLVGMASRSVFTVIAHANVSADSPVSSSPMRRRQHRRPSHTSSPSKTPRPGGLPGAVTLPGKPAPTLVTRNRIHGNTLAGVLLESEAGGVFRGNTIEANGRWGILGHVAIGDLLKRLQLALDEAPKEHLGHAGAARQGGGGAVFEDNVVERHSVANVGFVHHPSHNDFVFRRNTLRHAAVGLSVEGSSVVHRFTENTVRDCATGALFAGSSRAGFDANVLEGCGYAGVHLTQQADPTVEGCTVSGTHAHGVLVDGCARGTVRGNDVTGSGVAGLCVAHPVDGHAPSTLVTENSFSKGGALGVLVLHMAYDAWHVAHPLHSDCDMDHAAAFHDEKETQRLATSTRVVGNTVGHNALCGLYVAPARDTSMEKPAKRRGRTRRANPFKPGSAPETVETLVRGNTVEGHPVGAVVCDGAETDVDGNTIRHSGAVGVVVGSGAAAALTGNTIRESGRVGVLCVAGAAGRLEGNHIEANNPPADPLPGSVVAAYDPTAREHAHGGAGRGLGISHSAAINECFDAAMRYAVPASSTILVTSHERSTLDLRGVGVFVEDAARIAVLRNTVTHHRLCGIYVSSLHTPGGAGAAPRVTCTVSENTVEGNERDGIRVLCHTAAEAVFRPTGSDGLVAEGSDAYMDSSATDGPHLVKESSALRTRRRLGSVVLPVVRKGMAEGGPKSPLKSPTPEPGLPKTNSFKGGKLRRSKSPSTKRAPSVAILDADDRDPAHPALPAQVDLGVAVAVDPSMTCPKRSQSTLLERNIVARNGRYGVYVQQLCCVSNPDPEAAKVGVSFPSLPVARLHPAPVLSSNTFAANAAAAVCVGLSDTLTEADTALAAGAGESVGTAPTPRMHCGPGASLFGPDTGPCSAYRAAMSASLWFYAPVLAGNILEGGTVGVAVAEGSNCAVRGGVMRGLSVAAVRVTGRFTALSVTGGLTVEGCEVGIAVRGSVLSKVVGCTLLRCPGGGVSLHGGAAAVVAKNEFGADAESLRLTLKSTEPECAAVQPEGTGIVIEGARTDAIIAANGFRGCAHGIRVHDGARPRVWQNHFVGCTAGAEFGSGSAGYVDRNVAHRCASGICLAGTATAPTLHHNVFQHCGKAGVAASGKAGGTVDTNLFTGNAVGMLLDAAGCTFAAAGNAVVRSTECGVRAIDSAADGTRSARAHRSDTRDHGPHPAVSSARRSEPPALSPERSEAALPDIFKRSPSGLVSPRLEEIAEAPSGPDHPPAQLPCVRNNFFDANGGRDFDLRDSGAALFTDNLVLGGAVCGANSHGTVEGNTFFAAGDEEEPEGAHDKGRRHTKRCIVIEAGGGTSFVRNTILRAATAIVGRRDGAGECSRNVLLCCRIGVETEAGAATVFDRNELYGLSDCGAKLAGGTFRSNTVHGCAVGIVVPETAAPAVADNTVTMAYGEGVLVAGGGVITGNCLQSCKVGVRVVSQVETPTVSANAVMDSAAEGAVLGETCRCIFTQNDIFDNATVGLAIEEGAACTVDGNRVASAMMTGAMETASSTRCTLKNNTVRNQFSPAYKKGLVAHREKDLRTLQVTIATKVTSLEADAADMLKACRASCAALEALAADISTQPALPSAVPALELREQHKQQSGAFSPRTEAAIAGALGLVPVASGVISAAHVVAPTAARKHSDIAQATAQRKEPSSRRGSVATSAALVKADRSRNASASAAAIKKQSKRKSTGDLPAMHRVVVHRLFDGGRYPALRSLQEQLQAATEAVSVVGTGPHDPLTSVLRSAGGGVYVVCFPPATDVLSDAAVTQLRTVAAFMDSQPPLPGQGQGSGRKPSPRKRLQSLTTRVRDQVRERSSKPVPSLPPVSKSPTTDAPTPPQTPTPEEPSPEVSRCYCVVPQEGLTLGAPLFAQPAAVEFLRGAVCIVDDDSFGVVELLLQAVSGQGHRDLVARHQLPPEYYVLSS